jgi:hypothetical protein
MRLTPYQHDRLITYWMWRHKQPSRWDALNRVMPQLIASSFVIVSAGVLGLYGWLTDEPFIAGVALLVFGFSSGSLWASIAYVMVTVDVWPLIEKITDWDKVAELRRGLGRDHFN